MQGSVVATAKLAPDFRCIWDPIWQNCQTREPASLDEPTAVRRKARAQALGAYDHRTTTVPQLGDYILMVGCNGTNGSGPPSDPAATANATTWRQRNGGANWSSLSGEPFQISLAARPWLCITADQDRLLTLQLCINETSSSSGRLNHSGQLFYRNITAHGDLVTGMQSCPCWNGEVLNQLDRPFVTCEPCKDGNQYFSQNSNRRFVFPAGTTGQIHRVGPAANGWGPGYCVAALPKPPSETGWYVPWTALTTYTDAIGNPMKFFSILVPICSLFWLEQVHGRRL
eukprot:SAG31_NODE_1668_length_7576_cov_1.630467_4_plen_285_part_00